MKRVLLVTEFSKLFSGYAVYGRELLNRLHNIPGIEVAELAKWCYQDRSEHQCSQHSYDDVPWKVYPVIPPKNTELRQHYDMNQSWKFGAGIFNDVLLDFQPTHVLEYSDVWMAEYQFRSPYRKHYSHIIMPAIDAMPQHKTWLDMYASADKVLGYTNWGLKLLEEAGLSNLVGSASPCAANGFKELPLEHKKSLKDSLGLGDINVIGTVMRNQGRKLFPELFHDFKCLLNKSGHNNLYLLCHTSSPDTFQLDELILEHQIGNRVLFVYSCQNQNCRAVEVSFWRGEKSVCNKCNKYSSGMTSTNNGISNENLSLVYNMMDIYVQYAQNEGFGIPLIEALACGVPIMATDYSAMSEIIHESVGRAISVKTLKREVETGRLMAIPDKESFINHAIEFFNKKQEDRTQEAQLSKLCYGMRNWNDSISTWIKAINESQPQLPWNSPQKRLYPPSKPTGYMSNTDYAKYLIVNILQEPERLGTHFESRLIRDLNNGYCYRGFEGRYYFEELSAKSHVQPFDRDIAYNAFVSLLEEKAIWEQKRVQVIR